MRESRTMEIPSCYEPGYEEARALEPEIASNYVRHTLIADPAADALVEELASLEPAVGMRFVRAGMEQEERTLRDAPGPLRDFFKELESPPKWVDYSAFIPGVRMFHRNSRLILAAFVGGVLVEGFSTNIAKSFRITGRVLDQGVRRLKQNNRHMVEIFMPNGLEREGDGWKLSVRVRLVHAQVRRLLSASSDWDHAAWGTPLSAAHVGYSLTAFSARLLKHMKNLGADYSDEERDSFMAVWRYSGMLMGVPETILFRDEDDALKLFEIGGICEPTPDSDSVVMANQLVNSAPLVAGISESSARRSLAKYVYGVSRALIGNELADNLKYPAMSTFGVLPWFRMQGRYDRVMTKVFPKFARHNNYTNFTSLLDVSVFDKQGIGYKLPDHVHSEKGSSW